MFVSGKLTCFEFKESYLMVEDQDQLEYTDLTEEELKNVTCIRMNCPNVKDIRL